MKLTKIFTPLLFALLLSITFLSCEKECPVEPKINTVPGIWIGTYTVDQVPEQPALYFSFHFKPDNTLLTEGKGGNGATYYSQGTWALNGTDLTCTYSSINFPNVTVTQSSKFTFNPASDTLSSGTWKDLTGGSNFTGKYQSMKKVK